MTSELQELLDRVAIDCCSQLVPPASAVPVPVDAAQPPIELVAVIGFSGDQVRGAIGLCASLETLRRTHPATVAGEVTEICDLEDWLGESANQLLGRLKVQLQRYAISMWMGTPLVLRGVSVTVATGDSVRRYALQMSTGEQFTFWLDLQLDANVQIPHHAPAQANEPAPGDLLLF